MICKTFLHSIKNKPHQKVWLSTQIGRDNPTKGGVINELPAMLKSELQTISEMNYNFYADKLDKIAVLDFIFNETDLQIYDLGSPFGQEIRKYNSTTEITEKFELINGDKFAITFNLWTPRHKGNILFRRIKLDPKRCNGQTFRYSTDGWGLIQLYFGGLQNNGLNQSHIGHFSENGALKWEKTNSFNGRIDQWDWTEIQKTSRNLKNRIHNQMSIRKINSHGVLPGADSIEKQGIKLI